MSREMVGARIRRSKVEIQRINIFQLGTYQDLHSRPYQTHVTSETLRDIKRRVETAGEEKIEPRLMSSVSGRMLRPHGESLGRVDIPNGWDGYRYRFVMNVLVTNSRNDESLYVFQGYTSHDGISRSEKFDQRMDFIINSYMHMKMAEDHLGNRYSRMIESGNVIDGRLTIDNQSDICLMRPIDIVCGVTSNERSRIITPDDDDYRSTVEDHTFRLAHEAKTSDMDNNLPSHWLSGIVDSYKRSVDIINDGSPGGSVNSQMISLNYEDGFSQNPFFSMLGNIKEGFNIMSFTKADLEEVDPDVEDKIKFYSLSNDARGKLNYKTDSEHWDARSEDVVMAIAIVNSVPSIMLDCHMESVHFIASNDNEDAVMDCRVSDGKSLAGEDLRKFYRMFEDRVVDEVMNAISDNDQICLSVEVECDIFYETVIHISIDGQEEIKFVYPTFAGSRNLPTITPDADNFFHNVHDITKVMGVIEELYDTNAVIVESKADDFFIGDDFNDRDF